MTPRLLTTTSARRYLARKGMSVTEETLRRWATAGTLRHVRLPSGQYRFAEHDLDAMLEPVGPAPAA